MTDEHTALRRSVRDFLEHNLPVRTTCDDRLWTRLGGELGLTALALPAGGGSFEELAIVLEESGRVLLPAPLLETAVAAVLLHEVGAADLVEALSTGQRRAAFALDGLEGVPHAAGADLLVLEREDGLYVATGFETTPVPCLDPSRPQAEVRVTEAHRIADRRGAALARALFQAALAAESVGAAWRCLEVTVAHLLSREQFGRPLGTFQALRHRVADLTVRLEGATSTSWYAARAAARHDVGLAVAAPLALATCAEAFTAVAGEMIQLHGGIGFTWEHDAHLYFKRAWSTRLLHGEPDALRRHAFALAGW